MAKLAVVVAGRRVIPAFAVMAAVALDPRLSVFAFNTTVPGAATLIWVPPLRVKVVPALNAEDWVRAVMLSERVKVVPAVAVIPPVKEL